MKKIFTEALILALMLIAGLAVVAAFCFDTEASLIGFIAERTAFAALCYGCYKAAEKLYKTRLTTGK